MRDAEKRVLAEVSDRLGTEENMAPAQAAELVRKYMHKFSTPHSTLSRSSHEECGMGEAHPMKSIQQGSISLRSASGSSGTLIHFMHGLKLHLLYFS